MRSFAVFTYKCGDIGHSNSATIGFTAGDVLFANHPLTARKRAHDIACINYPESQWVNVVYELTREDLQPPDITGKQKLWLWTYRNNTCVSVLWYLIFFEGGLNFHVYMGM